VKYLIFIICLALPAYLVRFGIFGIPTTLLEILIYVAFVIGLLNLKNRQKFPINYLWPIFLMFLAGLISIGIAPDKMTALGQFKALFIDPILVFWLVVSYLKKEDFIWIFFGIAGSSLIVSIYSIVQKILGQVTIDNRVIGIFGYSPNYPALFLAPIAVMLTIYGWELARGSRLAAHGNSEPLLFKPLAVRRWLLANFKLLAVGCVLLANLFAVYFSGSRGALLAVGCGLVFYLIVRFWPWIKTKMWVRISLLLVIIITIISAYSIFKPNLSLDPAVGGRVTSSNNIRYEIWKTSFELGSQNPVFGLGLGNFQQSFSNLTQDRVNYPEYISPFALTPHNLFLMFWLSTGILGLIAFIWLLVIFFQNGFKNISSPLLMLLLSGMVVIIAQGIVDTPYFKNDLSLLFWLILASMLLLKDKDK
jgi:O-antigen ligase